MQSYRDPTVSMQIEGSVGSSSVVGQPFCFVLPEGIVRLLVA